LTRRRPSGSRSPRSDASQATPTAPGSRTVSVRAPSSPSPFSYFFLTHYLTAVETAGVAANVTLPSNIAPGAYLIRHEIIALHLADKAGGAEFYPSCSQIRVGGSGTGVPKDSELVSLPGAYSDTDPGILVPDVRLLLL
jgi:sarcosine oxidase gamma subunit